MRLAITPTDSIKSNFIWLQMLLSHFALKLAKQMG